MVRLFSMKCLGFRLTGKLGQSQIFDVRAFMTESSLGEARRDVATQRHRSHARHAARETERFARGLPANNALLWGRAAWANRRWSGLACDGECNACAVQGRRRATQEIHRQDIESLPDLMVLMRGAPYRFIVH